MLFRCGEIKQEGTGVYAATCQDFTAGSSNKEEGMQCHALFLLSGFSYLQRINMFSF